MKALRFALPLLVFGLLAGVLARGLDRDPHAVPSPLIGQRAPDFDLPRLDDAGQRVRRDDLRGKAWVLNVWASWCVACREEHALLLDLSRRSAAPIIGLDYRDARPAAQDWLRRLGDPYQATLFDGTGTAGIDWGVYGVPETFVIDRDGVVRDKLTGPLTRTAIETRILPLLKALDG
jgi:cytochrome c biogenesis protein CcmG/thiol:disulfide interchange protein DsbE